MLSLEEKRDHLVALRAASINSADAFDNAIDIKLVYTSNAIEGNPLTGTETEKIIRSGRAVGDVDLKFNNEAADLYKAVQRVRLLAVTEEPLTESMVVDLHKTILWASAPELSGKYSENSRRINGVDRAGNTVPIVFPNREKARQKLKGLYDWLETERYNGTQNTPRVAFQMHRQLIAIHPFEDGNGRTARLVMNMLLLRGGYSPVIIGPEHRDEYTNVMQRAVVDKDYKPHDEFMTKRLHESLDFTIGKLEPSAHNGMGQQPAGTPLRPQF